MEKQLDNLEEKYRGKNPFGVQSKMILHIDRISKYVVNDDTAPIEMEVNLTNRCNLKCYWCISENMRANEELKFEYIKKFIEDFKKIGGKAIIFSGGGEPTLHPKFKEIVDYSHNLGINLGLMTNGLYPKQYNQIISEKFHWVRFSLDTLNKKNFKKLKGVDCIDTIRYNIKELKKMNKFAKIWVNCNVSEKLSVEEAKELVETITKIADGLQFRPLLPRYFKQNEKININEKVWSYLLNLKNKEKINMSTDKLDDIKQKNLFPFKYCDGHFFVPILNANGDVCVCMYKTTDPRFVFGNIYNDDFGTIWKSERRRQVIDFVRNFDYKNNCQICCKLTEINKFLHFIRYKERPRDVNFL